MPNPDSNQQQALSVSELNRYARQLLEGQLSEIWGAVKHLHCLNLLEVQASVARCLRTPPYAARRKGLVSAT